MSLLEMSCLGAIMIFFVASLRLFLVERLPKKTFCLLWAMIGFRLLLPFSFPSPFSVYNLLLDDSRQSVSTKWSVLPDLPGEVWIERDFAVGPGTGGDFSLWTILWVAGGLAMAGFFLLSYWRSFRKFQMSLPVDHPQIEAWLGQYPLIRQVQVRKSDQVTAPLTYGVFRPVILLPAELDWQDSQQLQYVLAHEMVHIQRWDVAVKLFFLLVLCIHWFNPAVWLLCILANRDLELSCDETVLRMFQGFSGKEYAQTLLDLEERRGDAGVLASHFSESGLEERIRSILRYKRLSIGGVATAVLLCGATAAFAASPVSNASSSNTALSTAWETEKEYAGQSAEIVSVVLEGTGENWTLKEADSIELVEETWEGQIRQEEKGEALGQETVEGTTWFLEEETKKLYQIYQPYGLVYNEKEDRLYYQGKTVRRFLDALTPEREENRSYRSMGREDGEVDVYALRDYSRLDKDGLGTLIGLQEFPAEG